LRIFALTAYAMKEDEARCLAAGADGYLPKPLRPSTLIRSLAGQPVAPAQSAASVVVDEALALEVAGGDWALLKESATIFLAQDYPRQLNEIQAGIKAGDAERVRKAAHGIKGALKSFGGVAASEAALAVEVLARQNDLMRAGAATDALEEEIARFEAFYLAKSETLSTDGGTR
jgi:two-component system, sensor histidine kinase and response regulator